MLTIREARDQFTQLYLREALDAAKGNRREAARIAGVSRQHFHKLLTECGFDRKHGNSTGADPLVSMFTCRQ